MARYLWWVALSTPILHAQAAGPDPALLAAPASAGAYRAPYLPADEAEVLQEVPSLNDPAVVAMRKLRGKFDAAPHSLPDALQLANAYIDYGCQIGDAHYAGYAEAVITPWTTMSSPPVGALVAQATILQYRHQFTDAHELLRRAIQADSRNGQAWLTLATLDMVQGAYAAATKDCAQVTNNAGFELGLACMGNLRSYTGHATQALALLHQAEAPGSGVPAAYQAWVEGLIAETAERLGDWPLAEAHYLAALKLLPQDNYLLVAYADFLLDRKRPHEVLPLLAGHEQSDTAFFRLALAQTALHDPSAARYIWIMAARFEALRQRGSDYFGREEARFALELQHDPLTSLDMARRNWQVQRAPLDARIFLEAALAAHQPSAAAEVLEFLTTTRLEDPVVTALAHTARDQMASNSGGAP